MISAELVGLLFQATLPSVGAKADNGEIPLADLKAKTAELFAAELAVVKA